MVENTSGVSSILSFPVIYELIQRVFGARSGRRMVVDRFIRPKVGDHVLDVGCGPAKLLALMPEVRYVGYDPNPRYIEDARKSFGKRGSFITGRFTADEVPKYERFDIGLLIGVLHHLDNNEAAALLALMQAAIRPGGRIVTLDPVFIENQNPIARKLIEWDRGKNVRRASGYRALVSEHFSSVDETIIHKKIPPYTLFVMQCS
ncbi:MAG: class I SAM-dependent methyltransferase [Hyphomicrobiales bacterium]|nr:class I SAM-dependent methyltransferase [Hyphomicrobiales bacterium]MBV8825562.1 class I SAM-dependent methyltransferase [Hyphomicrobiales bacterium]MBV9430117.1 class I SAM-dependent methyltransferase [Bradyrhizobiaceae bacterium]